MELPVAIDRSESQVTLLDAARVLARGRDLDAKLRALAGHAHSMAGGTSAVVLLYEPDTAHLLSADGAHSFDARNAQRLRTHDMPADARWVDHAKLGRVALIEAPGSIAPHAIEALWWNTSSILRFSPITSATRRVMPCSPA